MLVHSTDEGAYYNFGVRRYKTSLRLTARYMYMTENVNKT